MNNSFPAKPLAQDEFGCNLDPAKCDCGKEGYCPLWNTDWMKYYNVNSIQAKAEIEGRYA